LKSAIAVTDILLKGRAEELDHLKDHACGNPTLFLRKFHEAMDKMASDGDDLFFDLFKFRYNTMPLWHVEFVADPHDDHLVADLEGALKNGHYTFVVAALEENISPYDWDELRELADDDDELLSVIETTFDLLNEEAS
jgi:hypothetical protein